MYFHSLKTRKQPPPQQPRCFFGYSPEVVHLGNGTISLVFFCILLGLEFFQNNLNNPELLQVLKLLTSLQSVDLMSLSLSLMVPRFIPCTLTLGVQKLDRQLTVSCNSIHRPIESIAVFKAASGPSGAACCFVQSSLGCIIKTLNFIEHAEKPIETWRVFPYIAFRMMSLKMPYVSLGFNRFEIEVGSRSRSGNYLVF